MSVKPEPNEAPASKRPEEDEVHAKERAAQRRERVAKETERFLERHEDLLGRLAK